MNLLDFIASPHRNAWIDEPGLRYYVRKSILFRGSIELANCNADPDSEVFGLFRFLKRYAGEIPFVMEQVINPSLARYVERLGWAKRDIGGVPQYASPLMVERYRDQPYFQKLYGDAL